MGQTANLAINPTLYPKMPYNAVTDFTPVALVAAQPVVLIVRQDSPYKTLADLVAAAKTKQLSMASAGTGTVGHLTGEMFQRRAGFKALHVPYKGASPALTDLMGGQTDFYFATPPIAMPMLKAGKLRALGVTSVKRGAAAECAYRRGAGLRGFPGRGLEGAGGARRHTGRRDRPPERGSQQGAQGCGYDRQTA
jgi:tripartite-type tricarboxylate transporter receptor subunit TctC